MSQLRSASFLPHLASFLPHLVGVLFLGLLAEPNAARGVDEDRSAATLMSPNAVAYVELTNTSELLAQAMDKEFGKRIQAVPPLKKALGSRQFIQGRLVLSLVEIGLGSTWREATEDFTAGGVYASVEAGGDAIVLVNTKSGEWLKEFRGKLMDLTRGQAKRDKKPDPFKEGSYRDLLVIQAGDVWLGYIGDWLIVTQKEKNCHQVMDRFLDGADTSLADNPRFQAAQKGRPENLAWGFVDVEKVRGSDDNPDLKFTDNILAEILFGGILDVARNTPYATSTVQIEGRQLTWKVEAPFDSKWPGEDRKHFFGDNSQGQAPPRLDVQRHLATIAAYRDISQAWLRSGDLLTDKAVDDLAQADTTLSTFFGGRDFGEDILSTLKPDIQLVIAGQDFTKLDLKPTIKLPAFALVGNLRDTETMKPQLRRLFFSFFGFLNVVGGTEGNMQLDIDIHQEDDLTLLSTKFVPIKGKDDERPNDAPIQFNFTPAVAFKGDRFIISSSTAFATELASSEPIDNAKPSNTTIAANGAGIGEILRENRESLISQNMLEDGNTREQAEVQIDMILTVVDAIRSADLRLVPTKESIGLQLEVELTKGE
jgi:hypothetical protein